MHSLLEMPLPTSHALSPQSLFRLARGVVAVHRGSQTDTGGALAGGVDRPGGGCRPTDRSKTEEEMVPMVEEMEDSTW